MNEMYIKGKIYLLLMLLGMITLQSCDDDDDKLAVLPNTVELYMQQNYPDATIKDAESLPGGGIEVDIWDGLIEKELKFDAVGKWLSTSWDIMPSTLPMAVKDALAASADYKTYRIDDADYYETPASDYYLLELEKNGVPDVYLKIDAEGRFLK